MYPRTLRIRTGGICIYTYMTDDNVIIRIGVKGIDIANLISINSINSKIPQYMYGGINYYDLASVVKVYIKNILIGHDINIIKVRTIKHSRPYRFIVLCEVSEQVLFLIKIKNIVNIIED